MPDGKIVYKLAYAISPYGVTAGGKFIGKPLFSVWFFCTDEPTPNLGRFWDVFEGWSQI